MSRTSRLKPSIWNGRHGLVLAWWTTGCLVVCSILSAFVFYALVRHWRLYRYMSVSDPSWSKVERTHAAHLPTGQLGLQIPRGMGVGAAAPAMRKLKPARWHVWCPWVAVACVSAWTNALFWPSLKEDRLLSRNGLSSVGKLGRIGPDT
ncbi:hypothetical protein GGR56DRAFT_613948 [Xylariaceae sp. FL0804]|nr:hypothetical protein GGR56DRAFT_613948 [Xylariaceae sp. FL0804]